MATITTSASIPGRAGAASPAPPHHTGLYHFAIRYPTRRDLARAVRRVVDAGVPIQGVADHGVSESIYLADLDGNGIELTRDRPESEWPRDAEGNIALAMADPLDLEALLDEAEPRARKRTALQNHANRHRSWRNEDRSDRHRRRERAAATARRRRREATTQATVAAVRDLVAAIERELGATGTVGIGIPGAISAVTGLVKNANSTWLIGQPLDRDLERALGRPVRVTNDANCFALSEATDGAAQGAHTVFGVILGTGTGGGIVVNRQVLEGRHRIAGEWGHNPLPWPQDGERPGPACYCGRTGCIETFLSGPGLSATYAAVAGRHAEAAEIAALAESGDPAANTRSVSTKRGSRGRSRVSSMCSIRTSSCSAAACRISPGSTTGSRRC